MGLPPSLSRSDDLYVVEVDEVDATYETWTATLPPDAPARASRLDARAGVASHDPYLRLEAAWSEVAGAVGFSWTVSGPRMVGCDACLATWHATQSRAYADPDYTFVMPDLSGVPGFAPAFELGAWSMQLMALVSTAGTRDFPFRYPAPAGTQRARLSRRFESD